MFGEYLKSFEIFQNILKSFIIHKVKLLTSRVITAACINIRNNNDCSQSIILDIKTENLCELVECVDLI